MFERQKEEKNFVERKRHWKGNLDKPLSRSTLIMMLPALIIGVFLMMSAPYLKMILENFLAKDSKIETRRLTFDEEEEVVERAAPPPSPEAEMARFYQQQFDEEGFDWRKTPEAPKQDFGFAVERPVEVAPIEVDLPLTMPELRAASQ